MDHRLVSAEDQEIEYLARKQGTTKDTVRAIAQATGASPREQIEAAIFARLSERDRGDQVMPNPPGIVKKGNSNVHRILEAGTLALLAVGLFSAWLFARRRHQ